MITGYNGRPGSLSLTRQEMKEFEAKGIIAVKGATYIRGKKFCRIGCGDWIAYIKGKGFVKNYYGTKSVALQCAERDARNTDVFGREIEESDLALLHRGSIAYEMIENFLKYRKRIAI